MIPEAFIFRKESGAQSGVAGLACRRRSVEQTVVDVETKTVSHLYLLSNVTQFSKHQPIVTLGNALVPALEAIWKFSFLLTVILYHKMRPCRVAMPGRDLFCLCGSSPAH